MEGSRMKSGKSAFQSQAQRLSSHAKGDHLPLADASEGKRSPKGLLTHHQPCGWSPALEKGGYTLGLAPIVIVRPTATA